MYLKWLLKNNIKHSILSDTENQIILSIISKKKEVFDTISKFEVGQHKLIRVSPFGNGKTHTSLCKVIFFEAKKNEAVKINDKDIIIEAFKAPGPGGQHKNKTESAIRIKHKPTGIITTCCNSRSQADNKKMALKQLQDKINNFNLESIINSKNERYKTNLSELDIIRIYNLNSKTITDQFGNKTTKIKDFFNGELFYNFI